MIFQIWKPRLIIIENSKRMEYSEKTVKLIARVIEDLIMNTIENAQAFHKGVFCINYLKGFYEKGVMR